MKHKYLPLLIWLLFGYATLTVFFGGEVYAQGITRPVCGDGQRTFFEQCDDGNTVTEACSYGVKKCKVCGANCRFIYSRGSFCSDGEINGPEECDDGPTNSDIEPNACRTNCRRPVCGDGVQDSGEECDDGNIVTEACPYGERECTVCSATCENVAGTTSFCGDGTRNGTEECDDGNTQEGDGCIQSCLVRPVVSCESFTSEATYFFVNSTHDEEDASPGDGECRDGRGDCTLRAAVTESNTLEGDSVIWIPSGTYRLIFTAPCWWCDNTDLDIRNDVVLCGENAHTTIIDGENEERVLIKIGQRNQARVENLTLTGAGDGDPNSVNGALQVGDEVELTLLRIIIKENQGFGILSDGGSISIMASTFANNREWGPITFRGGRLSISGSSFLRNNSYFGTVYVDCGVPSRPIAVVISNTTFWQNVSSHGGGIRLDIDDRHEDACTLELNNVTMTHNRGTLYGGGLFASGTAFLSPGSIVVRNSIIGRNFSGGIENNCSFTGAVRGEDDRFSLTVENSLIGWEDSWVRERLCEGYTPLSRDFNYGLGELIDSDLPGQSHVPLLEGSPAINAGNPATCPATDQLGHPRVGTCDIGAVEYQPAGD